VVEQRSSSLVRAQAVAPALTAACKVCAAPARLAGSVDMNRECSAVPFPVGMAGIAVYYYQCAQCGLIFTDLFDDLAPDLWVKYIYNDDYYARVDTDYKTRRPADSHELMRKICAALSKQGPVKGLDYGGGNGQLAALLRASGIDYASYDPYDHSDPIDPASYKATVVSVFEVLEHTTDPHGTFADVLRFGAERLVVIASTQVSDGRIEAGIASWDYITPRSGHVTIYSRASLARLAAKFSMDYRPVTRGLHLFTRGISADRFAGTAYRIRIKQLLAARLLARFA